LVRPADAAFGDEAREQARGVTSNAGLATAVPGGAIDVSPAGNRSSLASRSSIGMPVPSDSVQSMVVDGTAAYIGTALSCAACFS
jgi:hypothetical protein